MIRKKPKRSRRNFVVLFLTSHLLILFVALATCYVGFQQAFGIVREDILDSTEFSLRQCISALDASLIDLRTLGVQTARSDSLQLLGKTSREDPDYSLIARSAMDEYYERMQYYSSVWAENTCIYLRTIDRVIYRDSLYRPSIFSQYLELWDTPQEEWNEMCASKRIQPYITTTSSGTIFYIIPCTSALGLGPKIGSIFFRIDSRVILDHLSLVQKYRSYCLAIYNSEGNLIFLDNQMSPSTPDKLPKQWNHKHGVWQDETDLLLSISGDNEIGLHYILVLPERQAMQRLSRLRDLTLLLIIGAGAVCIGTALYASLHNGIPVNAIARALDGRTDAGLSVDLNHISSAVAQLLRDNQHLIQEQQQSLPALQKTFFHNLLKSDFVSDAEIEYMARRAQIDLTGSMYCAAELRLFPCIDVDAIDGQTVEDARVLQQAIRLHLEEVCRRPVWSYKRNTLEMLYIFEIRDQDALLSVLRSTVSWLRNGYQVESHWGVGSPCRDLTQFWRSAEEAVAALNCDIPEDAVCVYSSHLSADDAYYFPYTVEERLYRELCAGNVQGVEDTLGLLQQENFVRRNLNRIQFRRLNNRITEILTALLPQQDELSLPLAELENQIISYKGDCEAYFETLNALCLQLCESVSHQKKAHRNEVVQQVESYLEQNYADAGLGLAKVSVKFDLSEGYLSAIFKKETGTNFAEYLEQLRIHAACEMLSQGGKVTEISTQVGYNSIQSFRRAFKRVMGINPSEYRSDVV